MPSSPPAADGLLIDSRSLDAALRRLTARSGPVVGWGSGSVFDYFHRLYPVPLDALIDNDARRWGERRRGIEIVPPTHLERLGKPALVIIFSAAWPEIRAQAQGLGLHLAIPASALFADAGVRSRLAWSEEMAARPRGRRT